MSTTIEELAAPPGGLRLATRDGISPAAVTAADAAARHWLCDWVRGAVALGSDLYKRIVSRMFRETFNPYKASIVDWPKLSPEARERLVTLPVWDIAVQTEGKARLRMLSYANSITDADWRYAIALNGWEEGRHKVVLCNLVQVYGIALAPEPADVEPRDTEWAYLVTGFSECIDSFLAFGLFELAKRSGFFPIELVDTFEPVIQAEARHILLFANWLAWHRHARIADDGGTDNNFTVNGSRSLSDAAIKPGTLMRICLAENDRRFAGYDPRLLGPTTVPRLFRFAHLIGSCTQWHPFPAMCRSVRRDHMTANQLPHG